MAYFLACRVINGYLVYANVPDRLKDGVSTELINAGREDLIVTQMFGGTFISVTFLIGGYQNVNKF